MMEPWGDDWPETTWSDNRKYFLWLFLWSPLLRRKLKQQEDVHPWWLEWRRVFEAQWLETVGEDFVTGKAMPPWAIMIGWQLILTDREERKEVFLNWWYSGGRT